VKPGIIDKSPALRQCDGGCRRIHINTDSIIRSGYPITPSSAILQACAQLKEYGVQFLQAEDEIAAICSCIGAAFGGRLAMTCTSGPGLDLKSESLGLQSLLNCHSCLWTFSAQGRLPVCRLKPDKAICNRHSMAGTVKRLCQSLQRNRQPIVLQPSSRLLR